MSKEAIILAGGLGTRLRDVVQDRPKCLAMVQGRPFLHYLIQMLEREGIIRFIFSLGYMHGQIEEFLEDNYPSLDYATVVENDPLGTGGAIKNACTIAKEDNVLICNGDTYFPVPVSELEAFHQSKQSSCTLCLKPQNDFDRYGTVVLNEDKSIKSFEEKKYCKEGLINGGVYMLNVKSFQQISFPEKFSFESDYLQKFEKHTPSQRLYGFIQDTFFIDIGIPEDYKRVQQMNIFSL